MFPVNMAGINRSNGNTIRDRKQGSKREVVRLLALGRSSHGSLGATGTGVPSAAGVPGSRYPGA